MKKDDYLWDGSGEPDPEIEKLEALLGTLRSTAQAPELPRLPEEPRKPDGSNAWRLLAVAALFAVAFAPVLWWALTPGTTTNGSGDVATNVNGAPPPSNGNANTKNSNLAKPNDERPPELPKDEIVKNVAPPAAPPPRPRTPAPDRRAVEPAVETPDDVGVAENGSGSLLLETETALHVDRIEMLLRSFRNAQIDAPGAGSQLEFEREQSRELLASNRMLRLSAERTGSARIERMLDDVEPILLDIANMSDEPATGDVQAIRDRIEQQQILADLQIYAANNPRQGLY